MIPLLFPHTYLPPEAADLAAHFFSQIMVYQPVEDYLPDDMIPWVNSGFIIKRLPVSEDSNLVAAAVEDFQHWAQQHQHDRDLKTILPRTGNFRPPFFDDHATAQILTDLKAPEKKQSDSAKRSFNARLFLCLAQDFDQRRRELTEQLDRVEIQSQAMVDRLKHADARPGLESTDNRENSLIQAPEFMPSERLNAWAHLFLADSHDMSMLLTTSPGVIADLVSGNDQVSVLMTMNKGDCPERGEPVAADSKSELAAKIEQACHESPPSVRPQVPAVDSQAEAADLTLYLFANQSLLSLITTAADLQPSGQIQSRRGQTEAKHAVLGLLRSQRH